MLRSDGSAIGRLAPSHHSDEQDVSKIDRPAIDLPVAEAGGVGAATAADFGGEFGLRLSFLRLAALFGFRKCAFGGGRQRFAGDFTGVAVDFIVVIGCLHDVIGPEPLN